MLTLYHLLHPSLSQSRNRSALPQPVLGGWQEFGSQFPRRTLIGSVIVCSFGGTNQQEILTLSYVLKLAAIFGNFDLLMLRIPSARP